MNIEEYLPKAARTESKVDHLSVVLGDAAENTRLWRMQHAAFGLASELGELAVAIHNGDRVNIAEEISDHFWYAALAVNACGLQQHPKVLNAANDPGPTFGTLHAAQEASLFRIMELSGALSNEMKRIFHYRKPPIWDSIYSVVLDLFPVLVGLCRAHILDDGQVRAVNIAKLTIRYPGAFEQDKALNRDLNAELELLRKAFA